MLVHEFLTQLNDLGVVVRLNGDGNLGVTAPKGVMTADLAQQIKANKVDIVDFLASGNGNQKSQTLQPVLRVPRDQPLSISLGQERLWVLDCLEPGNPAYNMPILYRIRGQLNVSMLEQSINELINRHESLRTTFGTIDGTPVQMIAPFAPRTLEIIDLSVLPVDEIAEAEKEAITAVSNWRFDLAKGPLFLTHLIRISEQEHILSLVFHHIISDGWSINLMAEEISQLYAAYLNETCSPLPELPVQYVDHAAWQGEWLQNGEQAKQLAYWHKQLEGAPAFLELPTDHPRPAVQTYRGALVTARVPRDVAAAFQAYSQESGVTLFISLLAVFKLLLYRQTGQEDLVVGTPTAIRNRTEFEKIIGFFLNNLALRTQLSSRDSFNDLLKRVRQTALDGYAHQDVPFEMLLNELNVERDLSRTSLFQVYFNMLTMDEIGLELPGLDVERLAIEEIDSKFDLTIYIYQKEDGLLLELAYNADLFDKPRMQELLQQFVMLVEQVVANPNRSLSQYSLVTNAAKAMLPNPTQALGNEWLGAVHEQVTAQAAAQPDKTAVIDPQNTWTYGSLEARANQLAHHLRQQGLNQGDVVAVYAHRSASLVWALLGIHKAGGAFVILDPAYPSQRLIDYVDVALPRGFVQLEAAGSLPPELETCLDKHQIVSRIKLPHLLSKAQAGFLANYSITSPETTFGPDDLAYIAFTSGSTGKPKAIKGRHGPLSHFLPWQQQAFQLTPEDRFSMLSGLSHDPLQRDIFTALWVGATLCIPEPDFVANSRRFAQWMADSGITFAHMTPPMNAILTETAVFAPKLPDLRYTFFVGDKVTKDDVLRIRKLAPQVSCINSYGSTETQRAVAYNVISPAQSLATSRAVLPVGQGMPDVQILILNACGEQAGIGELGEIYVRSPHIAGGYLNNADATAQRFLYNPFSTGPHDKMYRSGDLGRYLPDGTAEFVGRNDRQVKIRGFRIELGEIESVLTQYPTVEKGIVVLHENGQQLVAYAVASHHALKDLHNELRLYLAQKLPNFMVPSAVMVLDKLPLTPNGKIDYRALPQPEVQTNIETYVSPQTDLERQLVAMWEAVLGVESIGVKDNFFALGGHSLLAVRLFTQIEQKYGVNLPLVTLFQGGTIAHLARQIEQQGKVGWSSIVEMQPEGEKRPFFCVHGITGDLLWFRELAQLFAPERPFIGLRSHGLDGMHTPFETIAAMAAHYISEMRQLQPTGPYYIGGASFGGTVALEMAQQLKQQGDEVALLVMFDHAPHNAGHDEISSRETAVNFLKNVPLWAGSFAKLGPKKMVARLQRQARVLAHEASAKLRNDEISPDQVTADDLLDYAAELPSHRRNLIEKNYYAMKDYIPQSYDGPVLVIQAQARSLFRVIDPVEGWKHLSTGPLMVQTIPGSHEGIFKSPNVQVLAEHLQKYLDQA